MWCIVILDVEKWGRLIVVVISRSSRRPHRGDLSWQTPGDSCKVIAASLRENQDKTPLIRQRSHFF